eukprot:4888585-Amphidinium_carterae.1
MLGTPGTPVTPGTAGTPETPGTLGTQGTVLGPSVRQLCLYRAFNLRCCQAHQGRISNPISQALFKRKCTKQSLRRDRHPGIRRQPVAALDNAATELAKIQYVPCVVALMAFKGSNDAEQQYDEEEYEHY